MATTFANIQAKTVFTGFTAGQQTTILAAMQTAYDGSATAKAMFDDWIATAGHTIDIKFVAGAFQAYTNTGRVEIDLAYTTNATYITPNGKAVQDTLLTALVHELGHGITGRRDNWTSTEYKGDNVKYVNQIYKELGLAEQVSYIAYDSTGARQKLNYEYTNGAAINAAESANKDWNSSLLGASNDLLIGGSSANRLYSGLGGDFLFGGGADDYLNGGGGTDTAAYYGSPLDYDIRQNPDSSWTVRNVRGAKDAGTDKLENIEKIQFDGGVTYDLKKNGLTFQTDFALVIDTTGSMGSSISSVKAQAATLIDAAFAGGKGDARIGVVGFKDTTIGEPSSVILKFTDQDDFAARKTAAMAAINGISVSGGGDLPETANDGLLTALNGSMGLWRAGAGVLRIALFTDAAVKDTALAGQVPALARSVGATISSSDSVFASGGSINTFNLVFDGGSSGREDPGDPSADPSFPFVPANDPITPDINSTQIQIFTIYTGSAGSTDTSGLSAVASANGGMLLNAPTNTDLVATLMAIITAPLGPFTDFNNTVRLNEPGKSWSAMNGDDVVYGTSGADTISGDAGNDKISGGDDFPLAAYQKSVYRLYEATLAREPELAGLDFYVGQLKSGKSLALIASEFVSSPEFLNIYGALDDTAFITTIYKNVLGRLPDPAGLEWWVNALKSGTSRSEAVVGFSESPENQVATEFALGGYSTTVVYNATFGQVYRAYVATLGRQPDGPGFEYYVSTLAGGQSLGDMVAGFVGSAEFVSKYGALDNVSFVKLLYTNVQGRTADATEVAYWAGFMDGGATRARVVTGFSESLEFQNKAAAGLKAFVQTSLPNMADVISGGAGNDVLLGGWGADTFRFDRLQPGTDQIYGFEAWDALNFLNFGYASAADALSHMSQSGTDVVFSDQGETIIIHNTTVTIVGAAIITVI